MAVQIHPGGFSFFHREARGVGLPDLLDMGSHGGDAGRVGEKGLTLGGIFLGPWPAGLPGWAIEPQFIQPFGRILRQFSQKPENTGEGGSMCRPGGAHHPADEWISI